MSYQAAAVILNYNGAHFLKQFLPSVLELTSSTTEVIVADNASIDDSLKVMEAEFPQVRIIQMKKNTGYAGGYNEALKELNHEFFILLNSDIEVTHHWDQPLVDFLAKNKEVAAVQPKILAFHNKKMFEYAGACGGFIDRNYFPFCRGRIFGELEEDQGQYNEPQEVFWATGACLTVRASDYNEVGGLDADFFAHMEEIDLCFRLKLFGKKIFCLPSSTVYHVGGGTLAMMSTFKTFLNYRNNLWLIAKNHFESPLFFKLFWRLALDGLSGVNFVFRGLPKHTVAILKAHVVFYRHLFQILKKRKVNKELFKSKTPNLVGHYQKNVIADYFLKGNKKFSQLNPSDFIEAKNQ